MTEKILPERPVIALVGNPNAGKTSVFNALTGLHQKIGNYPGVTVERVSGNLKLEELNCEIVDIPGLYSLKAVTADEEVAHDAIVGSGTDPKPDLFVYVLDVTQMERQLYLFNQLRNLDIPLVIALTNTDTLEGAGGKVDVKSFCEMAGTCIIPVVAHKGVGIAQLKECMAEALRSGRGPVTDELDGSTREWTTEERYHWAENVRQAVVRTVRAKPNRARRIDAFLTHRFFGLVFFVLVMYALFQSIYTLAGPLMSLIESLFSWLSSVVSPSLEGMPILRSLVIDGLINGVGSVIVFLPQIIILFGLIAALEGSGYLARAAFLMDRLLGWCGLNGRAFVPLLSSFACAIPGIMAARTMPDPKSRLATILIAPLMSCSARLPVYVLLIGAFIEPTFGAFWAGFTLFAMHLIGLVVAIPVALFLNRRLFRAKRLPFMMELPQYQWPKWRDIYMAMWTKAKVFVMTAGAIIVMMSLAIWFFTYFPHSEARSQGYKAEYQMKTAAFRDLVDEESYLSRRQMENSYLGNLGKAIEPALVPLGFDWRIGTSILAAFPAREVIVPSMGILFSAGANADSVENGHMMDALSRAQWPDGRKLFTPYTAVGLMVFFALCCQCMSTLATVKRETNSWKWPLFMFIYMTTLAYLGALLVHRIGLAFG